MVGAWMITEALSQTDHVLLNPEGTTKILLAALSGLAIVAISAAFGVAEDEMRIPLLTYLFAMPIEAPGTIS